jgi:hypothetical protein
LPPTYEKRCTDLGPTGAEGLKISLRMKTTKLQKGSNESHDPWVDSDYADAWASYRRRRLVVLCLFSASMLEIRFGYYVPGFFFALTFVAYFFLAAWLANWKCPRCGQAFFRGAFYRSILFGGRCFHCNLPKWCVSETEDVFFRPKFPLGWTISEPRTHFRCCQGQWKKLWRRCRTWRR